LGWHNTGSGGTTDTSYVLTASSSERIYVLKNPSSGNNVIAYRSNQNSTTTQSSEGPTFNYSYDTSLEPSGAQNLDASRVQAFYLANMMHDILYRYGFTETTFNFQNNNFGKGGKENDRILMSVQSPDGINNARMIVPPE